MAADVGVRGDRADVAPKSRPSPPHVGAWKLAQTLDCLFETRSDSEIEAEADVEAGVEMKG
jgi:hypothetical protein